MNQRLIVLIFLFLFISLSTWAVQVKIENDTTQSSGERVNMTFTSCTTTQNNTTVLYAGTYNQQIIGIQVVTAGTTSPLSMASFQLNAMGTTNVSDIANAKIYYTGTSSTFATTTQFGSTYASPSTSNYAIAGTQVLTTGTNYFWLTYDILASAAMNHHVDARCLAILVSGTPHTPTVTSPSGYRPIKGSFIGNYTIGAGGDYSTFTDAINELNSYGVGNGGATFNVTSGQNFAENLPVITTSGMESRPIIFQKSSTDHAIINPTGSSGSSDAGVAISGGDYITFDGIDVIENSGNAVEYGFYLYGSSSNGLQFNTIKNSTIILNKTNIGSKAIYCYNPDSNISSGCNLYNHFYNITASNVYCGIYIKGSIYAGGVDVGNEIGTENGGTTSITDFGTSGTNIYGMYMSYQGNSRIFGATIGNTSSVSGTMYGIYVEGLNNFIDIYDNTIVGLNNISTNSIYGIYYSGGNTQIYQNNIHSFQGGGCITGMELYALSATVFKNQIYDMNTVGSGSVWARGIFLGGFENPTGSHLNYVYNNFVRSIYAAGSTSTYGAIGLFVGQASNYTDHIFHNTVMLNSYGFNTDYYTSALYTNNLTSTTLNLRNNIFVNNSDVGTASSSKAVAFWYNSTDYSHIAASTNNNLYYAGIPGPQHLIFYDGTNSKQTLADYKAMLASKDQLAVTENPPFISSTDLHITPGSQTMVESGGTQITSPITISDDYDSETRSATPDIGADEGNFMNARLSGTKTIGVSVICDYPTITNALEYLNTGTVVGPLEYILMDNDYSSNETFPLTINSINGASSTNTIKFKPYPGISGNITISGNNDTAIWSLNNCIYVSIDGSINRADSIGLTIVNNSTIAPVISITGTSAYNTIKNCNVNGSNNTLEWTICRSVVLIYTTTSGNNNSILYCNISASASMPSDGVDVFGTFTGSQVIRGCSIKGVTYIGIFLFNQYSNGIILEQNTIHDFGLYGIDIECGNGTVINQCDIESHNALYTQLGGIRIQQYFLDGITIKNCIIHDLIGNNSCNALFGIEFDGDPETLDSGIRRVYNNEISLGIGNSAPTCYIIGFGIGLVYANLSYEFCYNSVYIGGSSTSYGYSSAISLSSTVSSLIVKDNIFMNSRSNSTGTGKHYIVLSEYNLQNTEFDRNDYYGTGNGSVLGYWGAIDITTLAELRSAAGHNANSISVDPLFSFGTRYLQPFTASPVFNMGIPIAGISYDILGNARSTTTPTLGAYELGVDGYQGPPLNIEVMRTGSAATISWVAVPGAIGYNIYYAESPNAEIWTLLDSTSNNSYIDTDTSKPVGFYRITAIY